MQTANTIPQSTFTNPRLRALLVSMALGLYCLLIVPIYFALNPISPASLPSIDGFSVGNLVLFAGESPASVGFGLLICPLLLWLGGRTGAWIVAGLSVLLAVGQLAASVLAVTDRTVSPFALAPGCTLITCGLVHTLFHLSQVPLFTAIALFAWQGAHHKES